MNKIIAEIGCNHKGDMEIAHEMIKVASQFSKADIVKFQKRTPRELLTEDEYNAPHPNQMHAYGTTYGAHREFLEFDLDRHKQLMAWCETWNVLYASSVWDLTAAKEIAGINPKLIKIPSACNLNFEMLDWICNNYEGEIHISFGMTEHEEEEKIVALLGKNGKLKSTVIYACTSGYPVPFEDVCANEVGRIKRRFGLKIKGVGFSGHHLGIAVDIAALTLGAQYFERHFTLDRTWKGTDHAASLEPDGLRRLARDIRHVSKALRYKERAVLEIESIQRKKLKRKNHAD